MTKGGGNDIWHERFWGKRSDEALRRTDDKLTAGVPLPKLIKRRLIDAPEIVLLSRPRSLGAERFRRLRSQLRGGSEEGPQILVVTSASPSEGKSMVAMNLALAFAYEGQGDVLLVDADMRRPSIGDWLNPAPDVGLAELLMGRTELEHVVLQLENVPLSVLPAGAPQRDPGELLPTEFASSLFSGLRQRYRRIIIDTPPIVPFTDADVLARKSDGVVIVARAGATRRGLLRQAIASVNSTRVLGTVLNDVTFNLADMGTYYSNKNYEEFYKRESSS